MRYIADHSAGKWLLVNTADASAKWYTKKYILQLSKKYKINGVANGVVLLADRDKLSFYLSHMLKPSDYSFYLNPNYIYYIGFDFHTNLWTLLEYNNLSIYVRDYQFKDCTGLLNTLSECRLMNIIGSKYLQKDLQKYYIIQNNSLIYVDSYIEMQLKRTRSVDGYLGVYAKSNLLCIKTLSSYYLILDTKTNEIRDTKFLPKDSVRLY